MTDTEPDPNHPDIKILFKDIRDNLEGRIDGNLYAVTHNLNGNNKKRHIIIQYIPGQEISSKTIFEIINPAKNGRLNCTVYSGNGNVNLIKSVVKQCARNYGLKTRVYTKTSTLA